MFPSGACNAQCSRPLPLNPFANSCKAAATARCPPPWHSSASSTSCSRTRKSASWVVPIIPDEARTFGMEGMFAKYGIYSNVGQLYEPVDAKTLTRLPRSEERPDSRRRHHRGRGDVVVHRRRARPMPRTAFRRLPFFIYYSMFGFQRIGDLIWAAADMRVARLLAGRHRRPHHAQRRGLAAPGRPCPCAGFDGAQSAWPTTRPSPTRLAVIIQDGIRRMYEEGERRLLLSDARQ